MKTLTYKQKRRLVASFCLPHSKDVIFDKINTLEDLSIIDYDTCIFFLDKAMEAHSPEELDRVLLEISAYIIKL